MLLFHLDDKRVETLIKANVDERTNVNDEEDSSINRTYLFTAARNGEQNTWDLKVAEKCPLISGN